MPNKIKPCPECGATGRQRHAPFCSIGQARSAASKKAHAARQANVKKKVVKRFNQPVTQSVATPTPIAKQLVNHIALVMDGSGSMSSVYDLVIATINAQIDRIKMESQDKNQATYLTVFSFEDQVRQPIINNAFIHQVNHIRLDQFKRGGRTALFDAIGEAITRFERLGVADANTSFLVVTVTDGQENASARWRRGPLQAKIRQLQGTDRWTFAFSGPHGSGAEVQRKLDFYAGNVTEWENTRTGTAIMSNNLSAGIGGYYGARAGGQTATRSFFTPDMSQVSTRDLKRNLCDVRDNFKMLPVNNSTPDGREWEIRPFVEDRLAKNATFRCQAGGQYQVGEAYYELTKPEDVQPHKDILVLDRTTGAIYGGPDARGVIGMPTNVDVKVKPGNMANYRLFIKSTSVNRKLVRGTAILYRVR